MWTKKQLFSLEKELIKRYPEFSAVEPRPIKIVAGDLDFEGWAKPRVLEISSMCLRFDKPTMDSLIKHELIHYANQGQGGIGHDCEFMRLAKKTKTPLTEDLKQQFMREAEATCRGEELPPQHRGGVARFKIYEKPQFRLFMLADEQGARLKTLRRNYKKTRKQVAKQAGVSERFIKRLESDERFIIAQDEQVLKKIFNVVIS